MFVVVRLSVFVLGYSNLVCLLKAGHYCCVVCFGFLSVTSRRCCC